MVRLGRSSTGLQQAGATWTFSPHAGLFNATHAVHLAPVRQAAGPDDADDHRRPPERRLRRPGALQRQAVPDPVSLRPLAARARRAGQLSEQPRVVGDHAGHAERLERPGSAAARRPSTRRARPRRRARAHQPGVTSRQWAISASQSPARDHRARALSGSSCRAREHDQRTPGPASARDAKRILAQPRHRPTQPHAGSAARIRARLSRKQARDQDPVEQPHGRAARRAPRARSRAA